MKNMLHKDGRISTQIDACSIFGTEIFKYVRYEFQHNKRKRIVAALLAAGIPTRLILSLVALSCTWSVVLHMERCFAHAVLLDASLELCA